MDAAGETRPPRTWRPMVGWTLGILAALGLAWFVGAVVVPVWRTTNVVTEQVALSGEGSISTTNLLLGVEKLGGRERAVRRLGVYLRLPEWAARHKSTAVVMLGVCDENAVPTLLAILEDSPELCPWAALALGMIGRNASDVVPALTRCLRAPAGDRPAFTQLCALKALAKYGPQAAPAADLIAQSLEGGDLRPDQERLVASLALGRIGPAARAAMPAMERQLLQEGHLPSELRDNLLWALREVGPDRSFSVELSGKLLHDPTLPVGWRSRAALTIGRAGKKSGESLLRSLFRVARDAESPVLRTAAIYAIGLAGTDASKYLSAVDQILESESDADARSVAKWARSRLRGESPSPPEWSEPPLEPLQPREEFAPIIF